MADKTPSRVSPLQALRLCVLLLLSPKKFTAAEEVDNALRNANPSAERKRSKSEIVRAAFLSSFITVVTSAVIGYAIGRFTGTAAICFSESSVAWIQIVGACVLLWGTLFVRGYEITTWCAVTYSERVNQWLYRGMYFVGTTVAVFSLAVRQCKA